MNGKAVIARFDGASLSLDSGVIALADMEKWLGVAGRLARCIDDPRHADRIAHSLADMIGCRMKMIAAGDDAKPAALVSSDRDALHMRWAGGLWRPISHSARGATSFS